MGVPTPGWVIAPAVRKWSVVALASVLAAGLFGAQPAWSAEPEITGTGAISGVVTTDDGAPASGVEVIAHRYETEWGRWATASFATAGPDGSYVFPELSPGDYRLEFQGDWQSESVAAEWWEDAPDIWSATTLTVTDGAEIVDISPRLSPAATISGTVTDEAGAPLMNVSVRAIDASTGLGGGYTSTDPSGGYVIGGLTAGDYLIEYDPTEISGPVAGEWWDDAASQQDASVVSVEAGGQSSGIDAVLAAAGSIGGVVTDDTGAATSGVFVVIYRATADGVGEWVGSSMTDDAGAYSVSGLAAGDYKVHFSTAGSLLSEWYDDATDAASAAAVTVVAGGATTVDGELAVGASIAGVVTDEAGQPLENVSVWAHPVDDGGYPMVVSTSIDGTYALTGLRAGSYRVQFDTRMAALNVAGEWWDDAPDAASAAVLSLTNGEVAGGIDAGLAAGGEISGTVLDGAGAPMSGVHVVVRTSDDAEANDVWTDADGSYAVRGLAAGSYRLGFFADVEGGVTLSEWWENAPDFASADDLEVEAATAVPGIDVVLSEDDGSVVESRSASLSGVVTDPQGAPLEHVSVSIEGDIGSLVATTDANGAWSMGSLPSGSYRVNFAAEIDGVLFTEWWDGAADLDSSTVIHLANAEQRAGIDAQLGAAPLPPVTSSTPKITGPLRVGGTVRAHPRGWTDGTQFAYQWYADGVPIPDATGWTLALTPELEGARLSVVVTGSLAGYETVAETSSATPSVTVR